MERIAFDKVGIFIYSPEEGTRAATLPDQIADEVKNERFERAMELQQRISLKVIKSQVGRQMDVLVEEPVEGEDLALGRLVIHAPEVDGSVVLHVKDARTGDVFPSLIDGRTGIDLQAEPLGRVAGDGLPQSGDISPGDGISPGGSPPEKSGKFR